MEQLRANFEHELSIIDNRPPFMEIFKNSAFLDIFFESFSKAPKEPSFYLYDNGHPNGDLRSLYQEFENMKRLKPIPDKYMLPNIKKSGVFEILTSVGGTISDTQIYLSRPTAEPNLSQFIESQCLVINNSLDKLGCNDLKDAILDAIINEDTTLFIGASIRVETEESVSGKPADNTKWRIAKNQMMLVLESYKSQSGKLRSDMEETRPGKGEEIPETLQTDMSNDIRAWKAEIKNICDPCVEDADIGLFLEHGSANKKLKIKKGVFSKKIVDIIAPIIDSGVIPQTKDMRDDKTKVIFFLNHFDIDRKPKTFNNAFSAYRRGNELERMN